MGTIGLQENDACVVAPFKQSKKTQNSSLDYVNYHFLAFSKKNILMSYRLQKASAYNALLNTVESYQNDQCSPKTVQETYFYEPVTAALMTAAATALPSVISEVGKALQHGRDVKDTRFANEVRREERAFEARNAAAERAHDRVREAGQQAHTMMIETVRNAHEKGLETLTQAREQQLLNHKVLMEGIKQGASTVNKLIDNFDKSFDRRHEQTIKRLDTQHLEKMQQEKAEFDRRLEEIKFQGKLAEEREKTKNAVELARINAQAKLEEQKTIRQEQQFLAQTHEADRQHARQLGWARVGQAYLTTLFRPGATPPDIDMIQSIAPATVQRKALAPAVVAEAYTQMRLSATVIPEKGTQRRWSIQKHLSVPPGSQIRMDAQSQHARAFVVAQSAGSNALFAYVQWVLSAIQASSRGWIQDISVQSFVSPQGPWLVQFGPVLSGLVFSESVQDSDSFARESDVFVYLHTLKTSLQSMVLPIFAATQLAVPGYQVHDPKIRGRLRTSASYNWKFYVTGRDMRKLSKPSPLQRVLLVLGIWTTSLFGIIHSRLDTEDVFWEDVRPQKHQIAYFVSPTEFIVVTVQRIPYVLHWNHAVQGHSRLERHVDMKALCSVFDIPCKPKWKELLQSVCATAKIPILNLKNRQMPPDELLPGTAGWEQRVYTIAHLSKSEIAASILAEKAR